MKESFEYKYNVEISKEKLVELFDSVNWETAKYPNKLYQAIKNSKYIMSVWQKEELNRLNLSY